MGVRQAILVFGVIRLPTGECLVDRDGLGVLAGGQVGPACLKQDVAEFGVVARQPTLIIGDIGVFLGECLEDRAGLLVG